MGNIDAAINTCEIINEYHPICVISVGVCGGIDCKYEERNPVDIVVSDQVIYYEPAKINPNNDLEYRPKIIKSPINRKFIEKFTSPASELLASCLPNVTISKPPTVRYNYCYASGEKVINDKKEKDKIKLITSDISPISVAAIDMESAGIAEACSKNFINFVIAKSIADFSHEKNDDFQNLSAATSFLSAMKWCESISSMEIEELCTPRLTSVPIDMYETVKLVCKAAGKTLGVRGAGSTIERTTSKGNSHDVVTNHDLINEAFMTDFFKAHLPEECKLSAEERYTGIDVEKGLCSITDPLDGTLNFGAGRPEIAISSAIYKDGIPQVGVINIPYRNMVISAAKGQQLQWNNIPWERRRRIPEKLEDIIVALPGDLKKVEDTNIREVIKKIVSAVGIIRITGALAYDLASLAIGEIDVRISTLSKEYDVAAGVYLVQKAGGKVTDINGEKWTLKSKTLLAAANPEVHELILNIIKKTTSGRVV